MLIYATLLYINQKCNILMINFGGAFGPTVKGREIRSELKGVTASDFRER